MALVTATQTRGADEDVDLPLIAEAFAQAGLNPEIVTWDDEKAKWDSYDLLVIRSTWDYSDRLKEFLAWVQYAETQAPIYNPAAVIRWNSDKLYMRNLLDAGIPTVPTQFIEPSSPIDFPDGEFVVKPNVGAGARDTARYGPSEPGNPTTHVQDLHSRGLTALIQPYMHTIDRDGERALVLFKGEYSHAIREGAVLATGIGINNDREAHPNAVRYNPTEQEVRLAERAVALAPVPSERLLYARADMVTSSDGSPCIMELELIEPNLFLKFAPNALGRFAAAAKTLLRT